MENTEFRDAMDAGAALVSTEDFDVRDFAVVPTGYKLEDLERFHAIPNRINQSIQAWTLEDLIRYLQDFDDTETSVFVERDGKTTAILDYHSSEGGSAAARWCEHRAMFEPVMTQSWEDWLHEDGQFSDQSYFAEFIEDHVLDIIEPDGADVLEVARDLRVHRNVEFKSRTKLHNGNVEFGYQETDEASTKSGELSVPEAFTIKLVAYEGFEPIEREVQLRYRLSGGQLTLGLRIVRLHEVQEQLTASIIEELDNGAPTPRIYRGFAR